MNVYIITTETFPNGLAATERIKCYAKALASNYSCEVLCVNRHEEPTNPRGNIKASGKIGNYSYRYLGNSTFKPQGNLRTILAKVHDVSKLSFAFCAFASPVVSIFDSKDFTTPDKCVLAFSSTSKRISPLTAFDKSVLFAIPEIRSPPKKK